jgi:hypothetical protein
MGLLKLLTRRGSGTGLVRLPAGSFTLDPAGRIVASTLPRSFPAAHVQQIGALVLSTFDCRILGPETDRARTARWSDYFPCSALDEAKIMANQSTLWNRNEWTT